MNQIAFAQDEGTGSRAGTKEDVIHPLTLRCTLGGEQWRQGWTRRVDEGVFLVAERFPHQTSLFRLLSLPLGTTLDSSKHIQFGVLSPQEIVNVSEFEVTQRDLYTVPERQPVKFGMLDLRLVRTMCFHLCSMAPLQDSIVVPSHPW